MSADGLRLDKWLWFARFCRNRSIAADFCASGRIRISGRVVAKAHQAVRVGDVLTFPLGPHVRVIAVKDLGKRRGPAEEARGLYDDLDPPALRPAPPPEDAPVPTREPGSGRPTKAERRAIEKLMGKE
jgi:ribosome-associated heat shock protein Hsp15